MASSSSALPVVVLLLVAATLVAVVVERVRIPYTVGLVIVGILVPSDALGLDTPTALSPSIVLPILLPPLLFEAAFALRWDHLAPVAVPIGILATAGVVLSAAVTGGVLVLVMHLPWSVALLFGALVAATDPVAVVAFFQRARIAPGLRALVEGESLLNDGTAVVLVGVLGGLLAGRALDPVVSTLDFLRIAVGGLAVGGVVGFVCSVLARGTRDYLVEATLSVAAAYGSYVLGEQLHVSGVLAVVGAGSIFGNFGRRFGLSERTEEEVDLLWRFLAFLSNSLVFLLLGLAVVPADLLRLVVHSSALVSEQHCWGARWLPMAWVQRLPASPAGRRWPGAMSCSGVACVGPFRSLSPLLLPRNSSSRFRFETSYSALSPRLSLFKG